ncbi:sigma-70 family RNA polymerase sigma factor [Planococcus sp. N028]|uniref:Sigma-70 family RNA polymerase sigma factor n=1 Tax=Planococcus shixiaomingii TaxID=3058393 RepID=A0ABT8N599_9BACL|nr:MULTISPECIES: sigma-70 family RNA polymerase sigma factor [unclassified Planococcus (in: firmicutes)]MDN7243054.1 sigma-70 family RNA polymerase sigma factor [Planococcus sp. N028]WKA54999.1 sigma-70 family RNA polymerase sigma factor [Planococcus sp. N022]
MEKHERDRLLVEAMDAYGHYLIRLAYSFVKEQSKAEDIVQEAFIRYYRSLERFEERSSVKTYLYRITVNECRNYFKSWAYRKMEFSNFLTPLYASKSSAEDTVLSTEKSQDVARAIEKLPVKYSEVLWLHYYAEFSVAEIAEVLNCSGNTVKTRLARGRKMASIAFEEEGIDHA